MGKKLQFPRTRHSRDRTAERAIKGGGRNLRPVISRCATSRARAFCRASQLSAKKDCGGFRARGTPVIGLRSERQEGGP